ncbi:MAG: D-glycerate dehydrogenase [Chloroflexi bacterium]|nr:D-glycerate dehydrogenase [Chloroflexota bacterium]
MSLPTILLSHPLPPEWIASLAGRVRLLTGPAEPPGFSGELLAHLDVAEGILCLLTDRVDEALLARAPRLRVVSNMAVGVDNIDIPACTRRGIPVGHTPGVLTDATADLTMAILLSAARRLPESARDARQGRWGTWSPTGWLGADLRGATLGIVGMGKIGRAVAERARGFGLRLLYSNPAPRPEVEAALGAEYVPLEALLRRSDFVSLHCPLNPRTRGLIDEAALRAMKPGAILVNAARGPVVDSAALVRALTEGWIAAAALDVTDPEPLPPEHPLYALPNCLIVPHIGSATHGARRRMAEIACENLLAGLAGKRLPHCVNPQVFGDV